LNEFRLDKSMTQQYYGEIYLTDGKADAMMCEDSDRPNEVVVHWWGPNIKPRAVLAERIRIADRTFKFEIKSVYDTDKLGSLRLEELSAEDLEYIKGVQVTIVEQDSELSGHWIRSQSEGKQSEGGKINFRPAFDGENLLTTKCETWDDFKAWANRVRREANVSAFRGHGSHQFRLKTTLQRAGRHRLERYVNETLPQFRTHAEMVLGTRMDPSDANDFSTLLGLAQHHGLPTPLLDWTTSPYIAAFFAFSDALEFKDVRTDATHVRIYGLTREFFDRRSIPTVTLPYYQPYIVPLSISPLHNPRLYAQQGLFLVTNATNIEFFLIRMGELEGSNYLYAADVPITVAYEALEDLAFMGLTAGTMFPGLDGVCRMMKHAMSFKQRALPVPGKPLGSPTENSSTEVSRTAGETEDSSKET
jgi:hypothetical protein